MNEIHSRREYLAYRERWITPVIQKAIVSHPVIAIVGAGEKKYFYKTFKTHV